ncbi:MAG: T9SS type A sorting domain-containing protein [Bacteroidota bacterium]|nr:T9SS type A sorting domain-containing protein [Bacteroidota bacterium]
MNNKIFLTVFIFFIISNNNLSAQNLLSDDNFEGYFCSTNCRDDNSFSGSWYAWKSQYANVAKYKIISDNNTNIFSLKKWRSCKFDDNDCPCCAQHSPDIRYDGNMFFDGINISDTHGVFARIGGYELIQQKFLDIWGHLESGSYYKIKFRVYVPSGYSDYNALKFMLAKNEVKYKSPGMVTKNSVPGIPNGDVCSYQCPSLWEYPNGYKQYKNNQIVVLKKYNFSQLEHDQWIEKSFIFEMPDQSTLNPLNWFVIDVHNENCSDNMCSGILYIDDIELTEHPYCNWEEEPCSPTDGPIHTSFPFQVTNYSNVMVTGLDNVRSATNIKIRTIQGQVIEELDDRYCINGINTIVWDGLNLAPALYIWQMTLENDCGEQNYWRGFTYYNDDLPIIDFDQTCNNSIQTPIPCCESEPDIYIEDETIEGPGELSFHAIHNIEVENTTVEANTEKLVMKAGNKITLKPGTHIKEGAHAHFYIEPCTTTNTHEALLPENPYTIPMAEVHDKKLDNETKNTDENVTIYPNPYSSELHVTISSDYGKQIIYEIFDLNGVLVLKKTFNCRFSHCSETISTAHLTPGIYILKLTGSTKTKSFKIVKQ